MAKSKKRRAVPDEFHRHEALHMASVIMTLVETELVEAEAIKANPDWSRRASEIHLSLFDLYQAIGEVHLDDGGDEPKGA
ncbi:MAG: hypothetical protein KAG89_18395 [Fulvimarina manganoxydans]|uniref:hypothetical protein n=1 Tax=Fulvimarina manganoxydans TaxID=937218 RepID=UPI002352F05B|nr:hypothetical protein [Fulvimarina manganoxydans]MCK5934133.1 hypothetical protein [Fulvimarina manganoxydans]